MIIVLMRTESRTQLKLSADKNQNAETVSGVKPTKK